MLRIIALLILLLSTIGRKFYKLGSIFSFVLYTISLFYNDLNIRYTWFNINNIQFNFDIYFNKITTLICSIVCLILTILHYSADILYKNNNKSTTIFQKYFNKIKSFLYKTCTNIKQNSNKYYNINEQILYKNNNNSKSILNQNSTANNLTLYRDCNKDDINNKLKLLNIFAFSMCLAICSKNIWQFYISVELLGLISSICIGIENFNKSATIVYAYNKLASIIFLFGTILHLINSKNEVSVICFTIACLCKSAQLPFSHWLIKATHANTLASILIHCATIIGVGIIFLYKFYSLFVQYLYLFNIILIISLLTSIVYPIVALYETNIKKIIACLTIASTGTMFSLCALQEFSVSIHYFLCHAFFKSLLFLIFAYYIEYFKTKDIRQFYNLKYFNIVGLIAVFSCIGIPPFIGFVPKVLINEILSNCSVIIQLLLELSNFLMDIVIFKLYLQYFKTNNKSIYCKFNIKPIYLLIIFSIIYSIIFIIILQDININTIYHSNNFKNICTSIIKNLVVIFIAYIVAQSIKNIPFSIKNKIDFSKNINIYYENIIKYVNKFNDKIERFYDNILYNYPYKLAYNLNKISNNNYKNQIKHVLIGLVIICIVLLF